MSKIVIALGGNALGNTPDEQLSLLKMVSKIIVKLVKDGHKIVTTHGNGPQVGQIMLATESSNASGIGTPLFPFAECGSMSQGYIGYHLEQSIRNEFINQGVFKECVSIVTQVLVNKDDKAFLNPTKPIGIYYNKDEALKIEKEKGYTFMEDAGRGYRRVVPSPLPIDIIEKKSILNLFSQGNVVIAAGGGGIPVIREDGYLKGVSAVIDKDMTASLLAKYIDADILLILTTVERVCINYNELVEIELDELTVSDAYKYIKRCEFKKGSMLPKVEACINFVKDTDKLAIITSLDKAVDALNYKTGTFIKEEF